MRMTQDRVSSISSRAGAARVVVNVPSAVGSLTLNSQPDSRWTMLAHPMSKAALNMLTIQYARAFPRWRVNSATPGLTAAAFTGTAPDLEQIARARTAGIQINTVEEGAEVIVQLAQLDASGPTGHSRGTKGQCPGSCLLTYVDSFAEVRSKPVRFGPCLSFFT
jgi:NAD(P)-dependent dehydrogenase (short-subunit alcohol dehydrogenase family)